MFHDFYYVFKVVIRISKDSISQNKDYTTSKPERKRNKLRQLYFNPAR